MSAVSVQQMADRVADLLESRLKIRGKGLAEKVRRGGRLLPRRVRRAAVGLAEVAGLADNPRLLMQADMGKVAADYDTCVRHLGGIGATDRRISAVLDFAARLVLIVLVVAGLVLAVMYWRGFLGGG